MTKLANLSEVREVARRELTKGTASAFAREHGLCDETVLAFLRGARPPAKPLLDALGWEKVVLYRRKY